MDKDKEIKKEFNKLNKIFKEIDENKKSVCQNLIKNASFMAITLQELQESINANGVISEYQNGENQWGTKKSPEVEIYNTMIKNYSTIIKQLLDLLPDGQKDTDELIEFISGKR